MSRRYGPQSRNVLGYRPKPIGPLVMGEDLPESKASFDREFDRLFGPRILPIEKQWRPADGAEICPACFTVKIGGVCRRCSPIVVEGGR